MSDVPPGFYVKPIKVQDLGESILGHVVYAPKKKKKKKPSCSLRLKHCKDELIKRDGDRCHYCKGPMFPPIGPKHFSQEMSIDHIVPRANGGSNELMNVVLSCYKCNHEFGSAHVKCHCDICVYARKMGGRSVRK